MFAGNCDSEVKIINILPDEEWFLIVVLFCKRVSNGDFSPLGLIQAYLE
jgi:hypothetical protein